MTPKVRRIVYAVSFEVGGLLLSTVSLLFLTPTGTAHALSFSVLTSIIAMIWSYVFNTVFEFWERGQKIRGRSLSRRVVHAVLFEITLIALLLPFTMWWFNVGILGGLAIETSLTLAFMAYTYVFTWVFDKIFGLPEASR